MLTYYGLLKLGVWGGRGGGGGGGISVDGYVVLGLLRGNRKLPVVYHTFKIVSMFWLRLEIQYEWWTVVVLSRKVLAINSYVVYLDQFLL